MFFHLFLALLSCFTSILGSQQLDIPLITPLRYPFYLDNFNETKPYENYDNAALINLNSDDIETVKKEISLKFNLDVDHLLFLTEANNTIYFDQSVCYTIRAGIFDSRDANNKVFYKDQLYYIDCINTPNDNFMKFPLTPDSLFQMEILKPTTLGKYTISVNVLIIPADSPLSNGSCAKSGYELIQIQNKTTLFCAKRYDPAVLRYFNVTYLDDQSKDEIIQRLNHSLIEMQKNDESKDQKIRSLEKNDESKDQKIRSLEKKNEKMIISTIIGYSLFGICLIGLGFLIWKHYLRKSSFKKGKTTRLDDVEGRTTAEPVDTRAEITPLRTETDEGHSQSVL